MQRHLTLALLLLSSTNLYAQEILNPEAHKAFVLSSNGKPVLSGNGNCVRFRGYTSAGKPSCYIQPEVAKVASTTEPTEPTEPAEPNKSENTQTVFQAEPEVYPVETAAAKTTAEATCHVESVSTQEAICNVPLEKVAPETPKVEPMSQPEPTITDTQVTIQTAMTYSYTTSVIDANIYFDFDKNNLRINEQIKLERAIVAAKEANKLFKVRVDGHTDSRGTDAYNYALSQRRINTIVNYLNLRGIETDSTMAWGESQLIKFADGSENYEHSRRAVVKFKVQFKVAN